VPAISIDTFFACSLMVLLVLTAMTATAKILQPLINMSANVEAAQRLGEVARHMLLYAGKPADLGRNAQTIPEEFGLAETEASNLYALDIDRVSRLNSENIYGLTSSSGTTSKRGFLRLSPINHTLTVTPISNETLLEKVYALTFNGVWQPTKTENHTFSIPASVDPCSKVLVAFDSHATQSFVEWTAYPQIPVEVGVDFTSLLSISDVYAYTSLVSVGRGIYRCTIFIGGLKP
jgi:hypothetical protein